MKQGAPWIQGIMIIMWFALAWEMGFCQRGVRDLASQWTGCKVVPLLPCAAQKQTYLHNLASIGGSPFSGCQTFALYLPLSRPLALSFTRHFTAKARQIVPKTGLKSTACAPESHCGSPIQTAWANWDPGFAWNTPLIIAFELQSAPQLRTAL